MAEGAQPDARKAQSAFVRAASTSAGERKTVGESELRCTCCVYLLCRNSHHLYTLIRLVLGL